MYAIIRRYTMKSGAIDRGMKDQLDSPELIEGELLVSREAAVGAR
jgi:hypothetical protein